MNRKLWLVFLVALVVLVISGCGGGNDKAATSTSGNDKSGNSSASSANTDTRDHRVFTFATTMEDSGIDAEIRKKFGELVSQKSDGKFEIEFFMAGQLGGEKEALEQMKLGELDMGYNVLQADMYYKEYNISSLPYFFPDYDSVKRFMDGPIGDKIRAQALEKGSVNLLGFHGYGPRWTTSNVKFTTPDEMKGLKIRMPEVPWWVEIWGSMGALPTPIAAPEIVTALKTGTVDAQENFLTNIAGRKMWEYQKYLIATKHIELFQTWLISDKTWSTLNDAEKKVIQESVDETIAFILPKVEEMNAKFLQECRDNGMEVVEVDRNLFIEAAREANKKIIERDLAPGVFEAATQAIENK